MALAIGPDVAKWQLKFDPSQATGPVDFAIQKVSDGTTPHSALETMWLGVQQVPVRGAYHYQRNDNWQAQADLFLQIADLKSFHILALDVEGYGNTVNDTFLFDSQRIINYLIPRTTRRVILYTNGNYYNKMVTLGMGEWLKTIPLWIADPDDAPGDPDITPWKFHQYSWIGEATRWGTGGPTDENVFNGTPDELKQWVGIEVTQPPIGEQMEYEVTGTSGVNLRPSPSTNTTVIKLIKTASHIWGVPDVLGWIKGSAYQEPGGVKTDLVFYCVASLVKEVIPPFVTGDTQINMTLKADGTIVGTWKDV